MKQQETSVRIQNKTLTIFKAVWQPHQKEKGGNPTLSSGSKTDST